MKMLKKLIVVCLLILPSQFVRADEHHGNPATASGTAKLEDSLAQLSVEDRQLAQGQKYCPVMPEVLLGEMGVPIRIDVDGQAVMVCCKGCAKQSQSDPAATLKALSKIQDRVATAAEIESNLAALEPQDREAAKAQGFCPIMTETALGTMGPPVKVNVAEEVIFVCCKGCGKKAQTNVEKTLATVATLKKQVAEAQEIEASFIALAPVDRGPARAQGFCAVMTDSPLGSMGAPVKVKIGDTSVYLCCEGCRRKALANPEETLATLVQLQKKVASEASK